MNPGEKKVDLGVKIRKLRLRRRCRYEANDPLKKDLTELRLCIELHLP